MTRVDAYLMRLTLIAMPFALCVLGQQVPGQTIGGPPQAIPDTVLYRHFLDHVAAFRTQADVLDSQGLNGNIFRYYFQDKLGLSRGQSETSSTGTVTAWLTVTEPD